MLPKCLNKNNSPCPLNYENVTAAHPAIVKNSCGGNIRTTKYLHRRFVPNPMTANILTLGITFLHNGNVMQIKLYISEPCGTIVSLVRGVSRT